MKRGLLVLFIIFITIFFSACSSTELICDGCGVGFVESGDYSDYLKEDAEIQAALNIDLYAFFCPDCREGRSMDPVFARILSSEESEVLAVYKENKTIQSKVDDDITIVESTGTEPYYVAIDIESG